jgi:hypothetical protein
MKSEPLKRLLKLTLLRCSIGLQAHMIVDCSAEALVNCQSGESRAPSCTDVDVSRHVEHVM